MNYKKIYDDLISSRKRNTSPDTYHENHHIIPRCMGGNDSRDNLVKLTAREHYIAHWLLAKIHGGRLWVAVNLMGRGNGSPEHKFRATSRKVDLARRRMAESLSGNKNPFHGRRHTEEAVEKIRRNNPYVRGDILGEHHHNYGKKFDSGPIISFVRKGYGNKKKENTEIQDRINQLCGIFETYRLCNGSIRYYPTKSPRAIKMGMFYRGLELGEKAKNRDNRGDKNPNWGNDKVSGDANGRFIETVYVWQNKETGETLESNRYDAYTKHGMSKSGVIEAANGNRKGTKFWRLLGELGTVDLSSLPVGDRRCITCGHTKWVGAFSGGRRACRACANKAQKARCAALGQPGTSANGSRRG